MRSISTQGADGFEASHLCHYRGCANPEHLRFESRAANSSRNTCQGAWAWRVTAGASQTNLSGCQHRNMAPNTADAVRECILPVLTVDEGSFQIGKPPGFKGAGEV